jgi:hypothetical protein
VRNEVAPVAPDPPLPHLVRAALKNDWPTPDAAKPKVVEELLAAFFEEGTDPMLRVRLARLLLLLDQTQYERDHPEEAGRAKGGGGAVKGGSFVLNVNIVNVDSDAPDAEHTPLPLPSTVEQLPTVEIETVVQSNTNSNTNSNA